MLSRFDLAVLGFAVGISLSAVAITSLPLRELGAPRQSVAAVPTTLRPALERARPLPAAPAEVSLELGVARGAPAPSARRARPRAVTIAPRREASSSPPAASQGTSPPVPLLSDLGDAP
ncbi:MAG: hypothetical protein JST00_19045 [Deltaproteobacteria bacterium]|nr:hypothetical protein [Deltaproteobacteria bacterium]